MLGVVDVVDGVEPVELAALPEPEVVVPDPEMVLPEPEDDVVLDPDGVLEADVVLEPVVGITLELTDPLVTAGVCGAGVAAVTVLPFETPTG